MKDDIRDTNYSVYDETMVMVEFNVFGENLDTMEFSKILGIEPSGIVDKKKKSISNAEIPYVTWYISTGYEHSLDVSKQLNKILVELFEKRELLINLKENEFLEYKVDIVIKIKNGEAPGLVLEKKIVNFLADIDAFVDIDIYAI